jgi:hypothetical protein
MRQGTTSALRSLLLTARLHANEAADGGDAQAASDALISEAAATFDATPPDGLAPQSAIVRSFDLRLHAAIRCSGAHRAFAAANLATASVSFTGAEGGGVVGELSRPRHAAATAIVDGPARRAWATAKSLSAVQRDSCPSDTEIVCWEPQYLFASSPANPNAPASCLRTDSIRSRNQTWKARSVAHSFTTVVERWPAVATTRGDPYRGLSQGVVGHGSSLSSWIFVRVGGAASW